jgi:hypothetical protein
MPTAEPIMQVPESTRPSSTADVLFRLRQALEAEHEAEATLARARQQVRELLTEARAAGLRYNTIARSLVPPGDPFESLRERRAMVGRLRQRFWTARKRQQRS